MVVDGVVRASPASTRRFVVGWYCSPLSTTDQAKKAGMDRDKYLKIHILTLHFMKYRLEETKDPTLARLLRALD